MDYFCVFLKAPFNIHSLIYYLAFLLNVFKHLQDGIRQDIYNLEFSPVLVLYQVREKTGY